MAARHLGFSYRKLIFLVVAVWIVSRVFHGESTIPHFNDGFLSSYHGSSNGGPNARYAFGVVTFTTQENSYTHISLKNKQHYARKHGYDFVVDYTAPQKPTSSGIWWHKFAMLQRLIATNNYEWLWWVDFDSLITNTSIPLTDIVASALKDVALPEDVDFIVAEDCNNLNAGSIIVRSSQSALNFLTQVFIYGDANPDLSDQSCLRDLIEGRSMIAQTIIPSDSPQNPVFDPKNPSEYTGFRQRQADQIAHNQALAIAKPGVKGGDGKKRVVFVPQTWINAYPEEIACYDENKQSWEEGMFVMHFPGAWAHIKDEDPYGVLIRRYEGRVVW